MLKLKDVRLKFNIRQKDVCDALNIPQNTYSQYENNKREPNNNTLARIADYFQVSIDCLLGRADEVSIVTFRTKLKKIREKAGLSQEAFAKAFGVAQSTVGGWESGARVPRLPMIEKIAEFFNVPTSYFVDGVGEISHSIPDKHPSKIDLTISAEIENLTAEEKESVLRFIQFTKSQRNN